jgi:signal peptidase II
MKTAGMYIRLLLTAGIVLAVDQTTKSLALERLDEPADVISGVLTLRIVYNSGGAFGLLEGLPEFFLVATVIAAVLILFWARKVEEPSWTIPLGMILGGGLGNLTDRVLRDTDGRVVDFIDLQVWPVFNVADACIVTGIGLVLLFGIRPERRQPEQEE